MTDRATPQTEETDVKEWPDPVVGSKQMSGIAERSQRLVTDFLNHHSKTGEGVLDFAHRIAVQRPAVGPEALAIADAYVLQRYGGRQPSGTNDLAKRVRRFNPAKSRRGD